MPTSARPNGSQIPIGAVAPSIDYDRAKGLTGKTDREGTLRIESWTTSFELEGALLNMKAVVEPRARATTRRNILRPPFNVLRAQQVRELDRGGSGSTGGFGQLLLQPFYV